MSVAGILQNSTPSSVFRVQPMSAAKIHGGQFPLRKIFSNDFNFQIPRYQRPYSWGIEQAGALLDDVLSFVGEVTNQPIDELNPYFLGSIVLIKKEDRPDADVVDGQQRLTTLTILFSALRHTIEGQKHSLPITKYLYEEGDPLEGNPNRYRMTLRDRDTEFFRSYIQNPGKIASLENLERAQLSDSQNNIKENALHFVQKLTAINDELRIRLTQFLVRQCLLVVVSTSDFDAAFRIFSILNDRGLDLSHTDILKADVIGSIASKDQEKYSDLWEEAELSLGRQAFGELFSFVRTIYRKQRMRESILKEFREHVVKKVGNPTKLIDEVLVPYASALLIMNNAAYKSEKNAEKVNSLLTWLGRIDNTDWLPPALLFLVGNIAKPDLLYKFFSDLERLASFLMFSRQGINDRSDRYAAVLARIESDVNLFEPTSPLQLTEDEEWQFLTCLDSEVYRLAAQKRQYLLLRLDSALSDGSATYEHSVVSIEHVLPQTPSGDSEWITWFPEIDVREMWTHRLGNLALLSHSKNSSAGNYDFKRKKNSYFVRGGVSSFALTTQILPEDRWTPEVVQRHHRNRIAALCRLWRLDIDLDQYWNDEASDEDATAQGVKPSSFHTEIIPVLEKRLSVKLIPGPNKTWSNEESSTVVSCQASKLHNRRNRPYWFGFKRGAKERLDHAKTAFCAFGLGSPKNILLMPYSFLVSVMDRMRTSSEGNEVRHWHVEFREEDEKTLLILSGGKTLDVTQYVL
jgi:hypothetical protein